MKGNLFLQELETSLNENLGVLAQAVAEETKTEMGQLVSTQAKAAKFKMQMQKDLHTLSKNCQEGITLIMESVKELAVHDTSIDLEVVMQDLMQGIEKINSLEKVEELGMQLLEGKCCNDLLKLKPNTLKVLYRGASKIFDAGRYQEAVSAFTFLSTLDSKQFAFCNSLGHAAYHSKDYSLATNAYAMASMCDPSSVWPHIYAANAFEAQKDFAHAKLALESAKEVNNLSSHKNQELEHTLDSRIAALK